MEGFSIRQGTIYEHKKTKRQLLLINHNIMNMVSLILEGENSTFDIYNSKQISVEELIALRISGEYEEKGDLTAPAFIELLKALLNSNSLNKDDLPYIQELYKTAIQ